jgi:thiosulfate/3-mercaptopyruvate sulfurtransferase
VSLITVEDLASRLQDPTFRIADVRWYLGQPGKGREAYEAGHIPGAIFVDIDTDLVGVEGPGRHPLPDPGIFSRRMAELGFGSDHFIVAYDDTGGGTAARLWWMLDDLGHARVAVLDGGIRAWIEAGRPLSVDVPRPESAHMVLADRWRKVIDRDTLTSRLGEVTVLDGRAAERYRGETEPIDPVAGHIPTALSAPIGGNLDSAGRYRNPEELRRRFAGLVTDPSDVVSSCGSGVNACANALAMRVAGLPDPLLYPGSYSDWSRAGMPVATGSEPGPSPEVDS